MPHCTTLRRRSLAQAPSSSRSVGASVTAVLPRYASVAGLPVQGSRSPARQFPARRPPGVEPSTHFPIVRGSGINGYGKSAGDTRNPFQFIELEVVARDGIEPSTRGKPITSEGQARRTQSGRTSLSGPATDRSMKPLSSTRTGHPGNRPFDQRILLRVRLFATRLVLEVDVVTR